MCSRGLGSRWEHAHSVTTTAVSGKLLCAVVTNSMNHCFPTVLLSVELTYGNQGLNTEVVNVEKNLASCRGHTCT